MNKIKRFIVLVCACLMLLQFGMVANAQTESIDVDVASYQLSLEPYEIDGKTGEHFSFRVVAKHDNLHRYGSFGYLFSISYRQGTQTVTKEGQTAMHSTVYRSILANGETISAKEDYGCEYISVVAITDIPVSCGDLTVSVTPITVVSGGTQQTQGAEKTFTVSLSKYFTGKTVSTMTFNMYHHDTSDTHADRVKNVIKTYAPDVIGFQEITQTWIEDKLMADAEIAALYGRVGADRGDSTHEQTAIFYRKDKFDLKASGTKWLYGEEGSIGSDTVGGLVTQEEREAAGQKCYYRVYTYVRLERKSDGQQFVFANTHLELGSYTSDSYPNKGDVQNKQIDYILNFAKQMQDQGYSVILTGDFNAQRGSTVCNKIDALGFVLSEDATTKLTGAEPTENDKFVNGISGESKKINSNIDHIYVLAESCYFDSYRICNETFADSQGVMGFPSDHLPRVAVFAIG